MMEPESPTKLAMGLTEGRALAAVIVEHHL